MGGSVCYSMASAITGAVRTGIAKAGARNCSVLVRYQGAKGGLGPVETAERAHAVQATVDWKKYSYGAGAFVAGLMLIEGFVHLSHDHHSGPPTLYSFRKIRNKAFPWGSGQDSLFGAEIDHTEEE